VQDVAVITDSEAAGVCLEPVRARLLSLLVEGPSSATALGHRIGLPRQKVNYHLRALEQHGMVEFVESRRRGNCLERILRATASSYVISPAALAPVAPDPDRHPDRRSAQWLLALASRLIEEVGALVSAADAAGQRVASFAADGEVRFASAEERAAFTEELAAALAGLVARYHVAAAPGARRHRIVVAVHPSAPEA
jgi:DNA-binding transcriptional ArsR family regulator